MVSIQSLDNRSLSVSRKVSPRPVAWDAGRRPVRADAKPADVVPLRKNFAEIEDVELLAYVINGDEAAWTAFFKRFRGLILSCAIKVSARSGYRLAAADLSDVLGDVSLNMVARNYRRLRQYRVGGGCSVASWVGVIATSTTRDYLRRARRHRLEPIADTELDRHACPNGGPEEVLIDREKRQFVDQALAKLSSRDRQFVHLYYAEAKDPETIAHEMGVSLSTVYSKKAKIKTRLAKLAQQVD